MSSNNKDKSPDLMQLQVPERFAGWRLDKVLATMLADHSRTTIQSWIDDGLVRVDDMPARRRFAVSGGEIVFVKVPEEPLDVVKAQCIPLDILYEDEALFVVNKPAGLVVHPGAGRSDGTMLNGLLHLDPNLAKLPRAGIVHRLDKNTSGVLVVARIEAARLNLIEQLKDRSVEREYLAIVNGVPISGGTIDAAIGRHPKHRTLLSAGRGKPAISHYRIVKKYRAHALLRIRLETGRTHQIRVHMNHAGYPLVGDPEYGGRNRLANNADQSLAHALKGFRRQALHAESLGIAHPVTGEKRHWHKGLPEDMRCLLLELKQDFDLNPQ